MTTPAARPNLTEAELQALAAQALQVAAAAYPRKAADGTPIPPGDRAYTFGAMSEWRTAFLRGFTAAQVGAAFADVARRYGSWGRAGGEFGNLDFSLAMELVGGVGWQGGTAVKQGLGPVEIREIASNGANIDEAQRRQAFFGDDGIVHRIEDADYDTARTALLAAYPTVADAPKPPDTGGTPGTGLPGIAGIESTPAEEIRAKALDSLNVDQAHMRHSFYGLDDRFHNIEDADYDAARDALYAAAPPSVPGTGLPGVG